MNMNNQNFGHCPFSQANRFTSHDPFGSSAARKFVTCISRISAGPEHDSLSPTTPAITVAPRLIWERRHVVDLHLSLNDFESAMADPFAQAVFRAYRDGLLASQLQAENTGPEPANTGASTHEQFYSGSSQYAAQYSAPAHDALHGGSSLHAALTQQLIQEAARHSAFSQQLTHETIHGGGSQQNPAFTQQNPTFTQQQNPTFTQQQQSTFTQQNPAFAQQQPTFTQQHQTFTQQLTQGGRGSLHEQLAVGDAAHGHALLQGSLPGGDHGGGFAATNEAATNETVATEATTNQAQESFLGQADNNLNVPAVQDNLGDHNEAAQNEAAQNEAAQPEAATEAAQTEAAQKEVAPTEAAQTGAVQTEAAQSEAARTEAAQNEVTVKVEEGAGPESGTGAGNRSTAVVSNGASASGVFSMLLDMQHQQQPLQTPLTPVPAVPPLAPLRPGDPKSPNAAAVVASGFGQSGLQGQQTRPANKYDAQKQRDWNNFSQYLARHQPPVAMIRATPRHVVEYMRYMDQFGRTRVHDLGCPLYGSSSVRESCVCPMKQAWGSLDALIGRLRAAFEENGGRPETNPFATRMVREYLNGVRVSQGKARGVIYDKRKRVVEEGAAEVVSPSRANCTMCCSHIAPLSSLLISHPAHSLHLPRLFLCSLPNPLAPAPAPAAAAAAAAAPAAAPATDPSARFVHSATAYAAAATA
ncbi:unnamed protein product [Closterium sp. NIES-53]